jgi:hypothetical protein
VISQKLIASNPDTVMKFTCAFASFSLLVFSPFCSADTGETKVATVMETKSYGIQRYAVLLEKSPFEVDGRMVPPPPQPRSMEGWALAGLTKATEYSIVNLVNLKTQERLRIPLYNNPPTPTANKTVLGGEVYALVALDFTEGEPQTLKHAIAHVTKNGTPDAVSFDPKVLQIKPAMTKVSAPIPNPLAIQTKEYHRRVVLPVNP